VCEIQLDTFWMAQSPGWMNTTRCIRFLAEILNSEFLFLTNPLKHWLEICHSTELFYKAANFKNMEERKFRKEEKYVHLGLDFKKLQSIVLRVFRRI